MFPKTIVNKETERISREYYAQLFKDKIKAEKAPELDEAWYAYHVGELSALEGLMERLLIDYEEPIISEEE